MKAFNVVVVLGFGLIMATKVSAAKMDINPLGEMTILPIENLCEVNVSNAHIDFGAKTVGQLQPIAGEQKRSLGKRSFRLNVVCPFTQEMRVVLRSGRSTNGQLPFGEGGSITLRISNAELDAKPMQLSLIKDGMHKKTASDSVFLRPDFGVMATDGGNVIKGKTFSAQLEVEPVLSEKELPVSQRKIETNFTLELVK
ncbi:hypothetical protein [Acinetobacter calcoaceticus]|uniref:hypothetical protein n=1 Tax=Acinetobacter calcoaceticus TaxID=471 RepID=UPI00192AAD09|nr:hypothetical protein [Acinetobacter calcoaceticus]